MHTENAVLERPTFDSLLRVDRTPTEQEIIACLRHVADDGLSFHPHNDLENLVPDWRTRFNNETIAELGKISLTILTSDEQQLEYRELIASFISTILLRPDSNAFDMQIIEAIGRTPLKDAFEKTLSQARAGVFNPLLDRDTRDAWHVLGNEIMELIDCAGEASLSDLSAPRSH